MRNVHKQIRDILYNNYQDIAFIIGNGINLHFFNGEIPSWNSLVCNMWRSHLDNNVGNINGVTLTELYDLLELKYCQEKDTIQKKRNELKKEVVSQFNKQLSNTDLSTLAKRIHDWEAPILTTNFDTIIASSLNLNMKRMGKGFTDFYPWNIFYSDNELDSSLSGFGIWHINGLVNYHRSIKLSLSDYMGCVERVRKWLHKDNLEEYFYGKRQNYWIGYNTWLHILFNKQLFIFGLSLEENEVFLRWLLIQRAKYAKMYNLNLKGWFVDKDIKDGKKFFLQTLGFEVININDHDELYSSFL